jgi:hypothetical protein
MKNSDILLNPWNLWMLYKRVEKEQNDADTPYVDEAMQP